MKNISVLGFCAAYIRGLTVDTAIVTDLDNGVPRISIQAHT